MTHERVIENYLIDMDGVLVHEERMIPGADRFIQALLDADRRFLILTNNSLYTPRDLAARLMASGLRVPGDGRSGRQRSPPPASCRSSAPAAART